MFIFYYILVLCFYSISSLPVNDDIFEWFKDDDNILPMKEFEYIRSEQNSPNLDRGPNEALQHQVTPTLHQTQSPANDRKEYWKKRRLHILHNVSN